MDTASSEPATVAPRVPRFTPREIQEKLDDMLGRGITSVVYSLKDYVDLAVKVIPLNFLDNDSADAIRLELAALSNISHPGVLKRHQIVEEERFIYIVMDRYDKTLKDLLIEHKRRKTPVSVTVVLSILRQLAAALAYLHGVSGAGAGQPVRCDLRPTNVLVSTDGEHFVIADPGLSRDVLRSENTIAGTAAYMAPEVLLRSEASPSSDMWSLGVIVYELATLRRPDFLEGKKPVEVFVDGWMPDLSDVTDGFIKDTLERILVLEPEKRLTARKLCEMLTTFNISINELRAQHVKLESKYNSLEIELSNNTAKTMLLEDELRAKSDRIIALETDHEKKSRTINDLEAALGNKPSRDNILGQEPRIKFTRIEMLEDQVKELESMFRQFGDRMNTADSQTDPSPLFRLIYAVHKDDTKTVQMLVKKEIGIGQRDEQGMTALMYAARQGHIDFVKLLVDKEGGLQDRNGWTALMHAAHGNYFKAVKALVSHEHGKKSKNDRTALMIAAEKGHAEAASVLVPYEKDLIDSKGKTALVIAAEAGYETVVEVIDPTDENGITALMRAANHNDALAISVLIPLQKGQNKCGGTALIQAAMHGHMHAIKMLLEYENGATDDCGMTALMHAAVRGHLKIVEMLVEYERNMQDNCGMTALMHAAVGGHLKIVEILLRYEGGMKDNSSKLGIMHAALNSNVEVVRMLFEKEGHLIDKSDQYFFNMIKAKGNSEMVSLLSSSAPGTDGYNNCQVAL